MSTFVRDVMTDKVLWVKQDTPFTEIAAALHEHRVSAFPVLDEENRVVGVVSESDLLPKLALGGGEDPVPGMITGILRHHELEKARGVTAADVMSAPAATVGADDTIEYAARLMYLRRFKRLPVADAGGHLVGIVSRADVLAVYDRPDVEIGEEIRTDIAVCASRAGAGQMDVSVTNGVVTLTGRPRTCGEGHDVVRRARHVHGVVAVRDRLDYPPPGPEDFDVLASFPVD
jgi:CBS-domain-containing membrane protein